jgi:hypothetical protein
LDWSDFIVDIRIDSTAISLTEIEVKDTILQPIFDLIAKVGISV